MLQKFALLKIWNCFKISRIWRNSHLFDMHFSQKASMSTTTSRLFQYSKYDPMLMTKDLTSDKGHFEVFPKEKRKILHYAMPTFSHIFFALVMTYYTLPCFFWQNLHQRQEFWVLQFIPHVLGTKKWNLLFTVTIHLLLFMTLFTPNFCLFKGGCPLCLKQVLVEFISGLRS